MRQVPRPDPRVTPPPVDAYLQTVLRIHQRQGDVTLAPSAAGTTAPTPGPHAFTGAQVVHLVTAANPFSIELTDVENAERNAEAAIDLDAAAIRHVPAVGTDLDLTWTESGFALLDTDEDLVLVVARDHWCQHGVYRWDADGFWLVLTDGTPPIRYPVDVMPD